MGSAMTQLGYCLLTKLFSTRMLTRGLFAVANLFVSWQFILVEIEWLLAILVLMTMMKL